MKSINGVMKIMNSDRKIIVLLGDGMADLPLAELNDKTPLEYVDTPNMDYYAQNGIVGLAKTVPDGMPPGSDTANLSIFGYDPQVSYSGRAPLEAINMDIELGPDDAAFRCNIVDADNNIMNDFSAGHIDTALTEIVIEELSQKLNLDSMELHSGVSYRNILVWRNYPFKDIIESTPPHDITGKLFADYLPQGKGAEILIAIMEESRKIIGSSEKIQEAMKKIKGKPESIWLWGAGRKPNMETLRDKYGLHGYTISAVDLIHGIGKAAGLQPIHVEGATGYIDTNYKGKAEALFHGLKDGSFVFLHVESPDESGHEGNIDHKTQAIKDFDKKIVGAVLEGLKSIENYAVLIMPDHPTPISLRTHTSDPVPFIIYWSDGIENDTMKNYNSSTYNETSAQNTGLYIDAAHKLIEIMIKKSI